MKFRIPAIDALRGFVMIIMALDHVRDFFHVGAMTFQPEDLSRTTVTLFFTRWMTHICAPVFMFTAGAGAYFWFQHGRTHQELSQFLWKRGLWLVVLELTALRFILNFSLVNGLVLLSVLWALGWSMVALGFLSRMPIRALTIFSIATIALHNLADRIPASSFGSGAWVWNILHQLGVFQVSGVPVFAAYPLIPWIAVMSAGFCFGQIFSLDPPQRQRLMMRIGLGLIAAFVVVRGINIYGDPVPWSVQANGMTVLSFLRCNKYPPSLDFLLMTLGPAILLLSWLDRLRFSKTNPLIVFGRVPLFYFLVHFFVAHALTIPFALVQYGRADFVLNGPPPSLGGSADLFPPNYGYSLGVVYAVWITVVILLYPLSLWFARLKERRRDLAWLSYF